MRFAIANTFQKALQKLQSKDSVAANLAKHRVSFEGGNGRNYKKDDEHFP